MYLDMNTQNGKPFTWSGIGDVLHALHTSFAWGKHHLLSPARVTELHNLKRLVELIEEGVQNLNEIHMAAGTPRREKVLWKDFSFYLSKLRNAAGIEEAVECFLNAVLAPFLETAIWCSPVQRTTFVGRAGRVPCGFSFGANRLNDVPGVPEKLKALRKKYPGYIRRVTR